MFLIYPMFINEIPLLPLSYFILPQKLRTFKIVVRNLLLTTRIPPSPQVLGAMGKYIYT